MNKKIDPNDEKTIPVELAVAIIAICVTVLLVLGYFMIRFIWSQPVSLLSYILPHLVIAGFFQSGDSHYKMGAVQHRKLLERRDRATVKLFKGIIIVTIILGILFCLLSPIGG